VPSSPAADAHTPPLPPRRHQAEALVAVDSTVAAGRTRAWVVLPPGAGKTYVGLEVIRRLDRPAVVFGPNTAIQGQWVSTWASYRPTPEPMGTDRALGTRLSALTYQSLATFDPTFDAAAAAGGGDDDAGDAGPSLLDRLHPNGTALVARLRELGPITIVLDECHHLLEVWGRLLAEVLDDLPEAFVLGLTATPPQVLDRDQAALVAELFGPITYAASIPAAVREATLAPFAELAWLTPPSAAEADWLAQNAERFTTLTTDLMDTTFGSVGFLPWLDQRSTGIPVGWSRFERDEPAFALALLRSANAGLLAVPAGARLREEHRVAPTADDWVALIGDWVKGCLTRSGEPGDEDVVDRIRRVLPSVGYQLTKTGIRRGRSAVDRLIALSAAKTDACVQVVRAEQATLGDRTRVLVLCDHESASAQAPDSIRAVQSAEAGSARAVLRALVDDPLTGTLSPMLVTGRTLAADHTTAGRLRDFIAGADPELAARLDPQPWNDDPGISTLAGAWSSRHWVPWATRFLEAGHSGVLVGTRALLGEGWDAPKLSSLVDLTTATTLSAVVQTRGRALRIDPGWADKVAITWTIVCVDEHHPRGRGDWDRLVRKHAGYFGLDSSGDITAGIAHVDDGFSTFAPPPTADFDTINARMTVRAENRADIRVRWAVGTPFVDHVVATVRIRSRPSGPALRPTALEIASAVRPTTVLGALGPVRTSDGRLTVGHPWRAVRAVTAPIDLARFGYAVADAMRTAGLASVGADAVRVEVEPDGEYRLQLDGVDTATSAVFAGALDELVSPVADPRYLVPRYLLGSAPGWSASGAGWRLLLTRKLRPDGVVWHAVPTALGVRRELVDAFVTAWNGWVSGGAAVFSGNPDGAGVLASCRGFAPLDVETVLRPAWS
jgi:superfamily II DNA or RNA helicase